MKLLIYHPVYYYYDDDDRVIMRLSKEEKNMKNEKWTVIPSNDVMFFVFIEKLYTPNIKQLKKGRSIIKGNTMP